MMTTATAPARTELTESETVYLELAGLHRGQAVTVTTPGGQLAGTVITALQGFSKDIERANLIVRVFPGTRRIRVMDVLAGTYQVAAQ